MEYPLKNGERGKSLDAASFKGNHEPKLYSNGLLRSRTPMHFNSDTDMCRYAYMWNGILMSSWAIKISHWWQLIDKIFGHNH